MVRFQMYFRGRARRFHRKRKIDGSVITSSYIYIFFQFSFSIALTEMETMERKILGGLGVKVEISFGGMFGFEMHI